MTSNQETPTTAQAGRQRVPVRQNGDGVLPSKRINYRRLGSRAAIARAKAIQGGRTLSAERQTVLAIVGRLVVLYENATGRLFAEGLETQAGEPRVLLTKTVPDLFDRIMAGLRYVFHDDDGGKW